MFKNWFMSKEITSNKVSCQNEDNHECVRIQDLPDDILLNIFSYLPPYVVYFTVMNVCVRWRRVSGCSVLWKVFDLDKEYSNVPQEKNDSVMKKLLKLRNWLKGISSFLLKLTVYTGYHEDVLAVVKDTNIIFPKVQTLEVSYGELRREPTDDDLASLISVDIMEKIFPNLTEIRIECFQILSKFILDNIHTLSKLHKIRLIFESCCESCMEQCEKDFKQNDYLRNLFKHFPKLVEFKGKALSNDTVTTLLQHCDLLENLSLAGSTEISVSAFKEMPLKKNLLTLCIDESSLDNSSLEIILKNSPNLNYLSMEKCSRINDIGLSYVGKYCKNLATLLIDELNDPDFERTLTDMGICFVANGCIHLKELVVCFHENITDNSLACLSKNCQELSTIKMAGCDITDIGIQGLTEGCHSLRNVDISRCKKITYNSVEHLTKNCALLRNINFDRRKLGNGMDMVITKSRCNLQ